MQCCAPRCTGSRPDSLAREDHGHLWPNLRDRDRLAVDRHADHLPIALLVYLGLERGEPTPNDKGAGVWIVHLVVVTLCGVVNVVAGLVIGRKENVLVQKRKGVCLFRVPKTCRGSCCWRMTSDNSKVRIQGE